MNASFRSVGQDDPGHSPIRTVARVEYLLKPLSFQATQAEKIRNNCHPLARVVSTSHSFRAFFLLDHGRFGAFQHALQSCRFRFCVDAYYHLVVGIFGPSSGQ